MRSILPVLTVVIASIAGLGAAGTSSMQAVPAAPDLARRIQAHYDSVKSFRAAFRQTVTGAFLRHAPESRGRVLVLKPGRVRWTYTHGQSFEVVSDGRRLFTYSPMDKMGEERPVPSGDAAPLSMLFLSGTGDLLRDFTPSTPPEQPAGEWRLVLTPKKPQSDFATLTLVVRRDTLALTGLITKQAQGETSTFQFSNLQENARLTDRDFAFSFPPGTQINK
jgi:outer membrane lipoprotein carrier protein